MTHLCCPSCRLRFTPAAAAYLRACPECGEPLHQRTLSETLGFRKSELHDAPAAMPAALAVTLPVPDPRRR